MTFYGAPFADARSTDVFLGPLGVLIHEVGKNFIACAFQSSPDMLQRSTKLVPVEAAQSMAIIEWYHAPLRRAFNRIKEEASFTDDKDAPQIPVKAINESVDPDDLITTLLVYGDVPPLAPPTDRPADFDWSSRFGLQGKGWYVGWSLLSFRHPAREWYWSLVAFLWLRAVLHNGGKVSSRSQSW